MDTEKHRYQLREWSGKIQERMNSGKTIKLWCSENGIREGQYYYWLAQIRKENFDEAARRLDDSQTAVALTGGTSSAMTHPVETNTFVELHAPEERNVPADAAEESRPCVLIRTCGMEIAVFPDTPQPSLRQLIQVLKDA